MTSNPIITSPVLIPYAPDCEYQYGEDVLPPEKIERLANSFEKYKIIDLQHEFTKRLINKLEPIPRGKLLKSYITSKDIKLKGLDGYIREYPSGTWIIVVEITDKEAQKLYNKGLITGLSITVKEKDHADAIIEFLNDKHIPFLPEHIIEAEKGFYKKPKRILMKDVINPVAFTVSLVKSPCVYGAKFCQNSCMIVNKDKLKENKNLNLKEKIKSQLNELIDGIDMEQESVKEDVVEDVEEIEAEADSESSKSADDVETKTIYGRKVKTESTKSEPNEESVKEDSGEGESSDTSEGEGSEGENESEESSEGEESEEEDNGTSKGKVKKEAQKEDLSESETSSESDKDVLYLAQDEVENLISTTLRRYAEEIEQMVFDGIQEALDDYLFSDASSYKETVDEEEEEEKPEEVEEEESQKEYATAEMVQSMFDEQFASFKSSIMEGIKDAQKESIKSYSKAINPSDDGFSNESNKETFKPKVQRDFNGCRIRKR